MSQNLSSFGSDDASSHIETMSLADKDFEWTEQDAGEEEETKEE
jgi:hypothetical protein